MNLFLCFAFFLLSPIKLMSNNETFQININSLKTKITYFVIESNVPELSEKIYKNLECTKRFNLQKDITSSTDIIIKVRQFSNKKIKLEMVDNVQNKTIWTKTIKRLTPKIIEQISNEIYEKWTYEEGIYSLKLIFSVYKKNNQYSLYTVNFNKDNLRLISSEISYINNLTTLDNSIFITKFLPEIQGYGIFCLNLKNQQLYEIFSIKNCSSFSPWIENEELYFSVTNKGTTGIYKIPLKKAKRYKNFEEFIKDPLVTTLTKLKNKIATSLSTYKNIKVFCSDLNNQASIYIFPSRKISSNQGSYYDPVVLNQKILAAIKVYQGNFHLVLIDLKKGNEKILLSKYFISKPAWSPCGNWIAVTCRNANEPDRIILVHKTGKYLQEIKTNYHIKHITWLQ